MLLGKKGGNFGDNPQAVFARKCKYLPVHFILDPMLSLKGYLIQVKKRSPDRCSDLESPLLFNQSFIKNLSRKMQKPDEKSG